MSWNSLSGIFNSILSNGDAVSSPTSVPDRVNRPDIRSQGSRPVINQEDWVVCGQSAKGGAKISHETLKVTLAVQRPHDESCA